MFDHPICDGFVEGMSVVITVNISIYLTKQKIRLE